jgi:hypothetical protein
MIRHIVFFSAKRKSNVDAIVRGLGILAQIPHVRRFEVAKNRKTDPLSVEVDIVVYGEFDDEAALQAYKAHPIYEEATRCVRPLRDLRLAAHYDVDDALISHEQGGAPMVSPTLPRSA